MKYTFLVYHESIFRKRGILYKNILFLTKLGIFPFSYIPPFLYTVVIPTYNENKQAY